MVRPATLRAILLLVLLLVVLSLSTCVPWWLDMFPSWYSYVEASVDLRAIMVHQGLGDLAVPFNVEYAPYILGANDYSKVVVAAAGNGTKRLLLLDPYNLEFRHAAFDGGFDRSLGSVAHGFLSGSRIVDPANPTIIIPSPGWTNPSAVRVYRVGIGATGTNYAVDVQSSTQLIFTEYNHDFSVGAHLNRDIDSIGTIGYDLIDADYANGYSVLVKYRNDIDGLWYASAYSEPTNAGFFTVDDIFDTPTDPPYQTGPFPVSDEWAWLTEAGPVAFVRGKDGGSDRLVRYRYGTGSFDLSFGDFSLGFSPSEEIDSIPFEEDEEMQALSFDPSGKWWFAYNWRTGILYKLRTWWE